MYKVNCITDDSGRCDTVYVTVYDSLDDLGFDILYELDEQSEHNNEVSYMRPRAEVIRDFMR
jgi:hypothetical protein